MDVLKMYELHGKIAQRYEQACAEAGLTPDARLKTRMDLEHVEVLYPKYRWEEMLNSPASEFNHDIFGIKRNLNRSTGKMEDQFHPRYA